MINFQGVFLPDGETHLVEWMTKAGELVDGKGTYQIKKLREALKHVKQFRTAVDIGGHCGLWSMQLVKRFAKLHAFEPVAAHRECFRANLPGLTSIEVQGGPGGIEVASGPVGPCAVKLYNCALGDHEDSIQIKTEPASSGDSRVNGKGDIPLRTLDSFKLEEVDFIKIDTEGYELYAVLGAEETIKRCRPVMIVEQKGHGMQYFGFRKEEAVEKLESWGMRRVLNLSGDIILVWP